MVTIGLALLLSLVASFADVIGGALTVIKELSQRKIVWFTALGAGFLLGATFMDRLPDVVSQLQASAPLFIVAGYLGMLWLNSFGAAHQHVIPSMVVESANDYGVSETAAAAGAETLAFHATHVHEAPSPTLSRREGAVTFAGMLIHTFMDGVIVAGAFAANTATGILMFLAIVLHKIPEGFTMATISLATGQSRKTAFTTSIGLGISTMVGAVVTLVAGQFDAYAVKVVMALATGTFIFISTTGLIPAVKQSRDRRAVYIVIVGVVLFYLSLQLVQSVGLK